MFEGSYVALITPMTCAGELDEKALQNLVHWHIKNGTNGLVPVGTTGESPALSNDEHKRVVEVVIKEAQSQIKVIAGCGSNNTKEAIDFHLSAFEAGADAALHVTGYYNRPSQEGIYQHFAELNSTCELPIIVYNVPSRTIVDISIDTMARIAMLDHVVGVKDATKDLSRPGLERLKIHKPFSYLTGEDATAVAYNASGGMGCISVTANVAPSLCAQMQSAWRSGNYQVAMEIQQSLAPLHDALFREPSPAGAKYACSRLGLCSDSLRLPITELGENTKKEIDQVMDALELKSDAVS